MLHPFQTVPLDVRLLLRGDHFRRDLQMRIGDKIPQPGILPAKPCRNWQTFAGNHVQSGRQIFVHVQFGRGDAGRETG